MVYFKVVRRLSLWGSIAAVLMTSVPPLALRAGAAPSPAAAGPTDPWLIVPGQSLGALRLGVPFQTLHQMAGWGQPDRTHIAGSIAFHTYARVGVTVAVRDQAVVMALTTNERFRTDKGVSVGRASSAATAAYGQPGDGQERTLWFDSLGLVVVVGGGTIVRIGIYDPKTLVRVILAEERPARDVFLTARPPKYGSPARAKAADAKVATGMKSVTVTLTLRNGAAVTKVLNPNFFVLLGGQGKTYRYDASTFTLSDACRSTKQVRPGESIACSVVFVIPAGETAKAILYADGASVGEASL